MDAAGELDSLLRGGARVIVVSAKDVDLRGTTSDNRMFLLRIGEGSLAAGGRGGGFGERRVTTVICFDSRNGVWSKLFEVGEGERSSDFEVPYHVSRLPMTLADGTEEMGYGVVDPELVNEFMTRSKSLSLLK